ncbi:MAG: radical SAM protein [Campylobacteraceae bacterium]
MQDNEVVSRDEHFLNAIKNTPFLSLHVNTKEFIKEMAFSYHLSHSQIINIVTIAIDLEMWGEDIKALWENKESKKEAISRLEKKYETLKNTPKSYKNFSVKPKKENYTIKNVEKSSFGFGSCPVASPKTRCCNLLTLDVFEGCGFGCSYCSIQSFYSNGEITKDANFKEKLFGLQIDKEKIYHIGTGQSSDSLMFGNKDGVLETLIEFARQNKNVILEFKSKSNNVKFLLENELPKNIICTFSLNPQSIIDNEEHFAASLDERINSARKLADCGILVGFHFHPMVVFEGYEDEYSQIATKLLDTFKPSEVVLISMGTLTFIKPVLKKIRERADKSKILQMPFTEASGKFSYPISVKKEMFKMLYNAFEPWHKKVFFYMCMEDVSLWSEVFGREYKNNEEFEEAMKKAYIEKITKVDL